MKVYTEYAFSFLILSSPLFFFAFVFLRYMECKFNKSRGVSNSEVKIGDHIIPQVTRFKYLGSVIQDDGEIEGDVNHRIQAGWMKWRKASGVLCDAKVPIKLRRIGKL